MLCLIIGLLVSLSSAEVTPTPTFGWSSSNTTTRTTSVTSTPTATVSIRMSQAGITPTDSVLRTFTATRRAPPPLASPTADPPRDSDDDDDELPGGVIAIIVILSLAGAAGVGFLARWYLQQRKVNLNQEVNRGGAPLLSEGRNEPTRDALPPSSLKRHTNKMRPEPLEPLGTVGGASAKAVVAPPSPTTPIADTPLPTLEDTMCPPPTVELESAVSSPRGGKEPDTAPMCPVPTPPSMWKYLGLSPSPPHEVLRETPGPCLPPILGEPIMEPPDEVVHDLGLDEPTPDIFELEERAEGKPDTDEAALILKAAKRAENERLDKVIQLARVGYDVRGFL